MTTELCTPQTPCSGGQLTACKSNCKNIASALEMYASDHKGHDPARLEDLIPGNYLRTLPTCPAAGRMTYEYQVTVKPDLASPAAATTTRTWPPVCPTSTRRPA